MSAYDTNTTSVFPLPLDPPLPAEEPSEPSPLPLSPRKLPDWLHAHIHTPNDLTQERHSAIVFQPDQPHRVEGAALDLQ